MSVITHFTKGGISASITNRIGKYEHAERLEYFAQIFCKKIMQLSIDRTEALRKMKIFNADFFLAAMTTHAVHVYFGMQKKLTHELNIQFLSFLEGGPSDQKKEIDNCIEEHTSEVIYRFSVSNALLSGDNSGRIEIAVREAEKYYNAVTIGASESVDSIPKVFVSYSHDNDEHKAWVINLSDRILDKGVEVILDHYDLELGNDLPAFMEAGISQSNYVLIICTDLYNKKANEGVDGVGYEKRIVVAEIYRKGGNDKFIPIVRECNTDNPVPTFFGVPKYLDMRNDDEFEIKLRELIGKIHDRPINPKPPTGDKPYTEEKAYHPDAGEPSSASPTRSDFRVFFENGKETFLIQHPIIPEALQEWPEQELQKYKEKYPSVSEEDETEYAKDIKERAFQHVRSGLALHESQLPEYRKKGQDVLNNEILPGLYYGASGFLSSIHEKAKYISRIIPVNLIICNDGKTQAVGIQVQLSLPDNLTPITDLAVPKTEPVPALPLEKTVVYDQDMQKLKEESESLDISGSIVRHVREIDPADETFRIIGPDEDKIIFPYDVIYSKKKLTQQSKWRVPGFYLLLPEANSPEQIILKCRLISENVPGAIDGELRISIESKKL